MGKFIQENYDAIFKKYSNDELLKDIDLYIYIKRVDYQNF